MTVETWVLQQKDGNSKNQLKGNAKSTAREIENTFILDGLISGISMTK